MQSLESHHYACSFLILKYFILIHDYGTSVSLIHSFYSFTHFSFIISTLLCTGQTFPWSSWSKYSAACSIVSQTFHIYFPSNMSQTNLPFSPINPTLILLYIQCLLREQRPNFNDAQVCLNFLSLGSVRSFNFLITNLQLLKLI